MVMYSPQHLVDQLDQYAVGQIRAKKDLAILGFLHMMRHQVEKSDWMDKVEEYVDAKLEADASLPYFTLSEDGTKAKKEDLTESKVRSEEKKRFPFMAYLTHHERLMDPLHGLVIGPTGCGKTYLITLLGKLLGVPVLTISANHLSNMGYVGTDIAETLHHCLETIDPHQYSEEQARYSIVFIDEIDKLCGGSDSEFNFAQRIQNTLLTALEGSPIRVDIGGGKGLVEIDPSRFMFLFGGNFQPMRDAKRKEGAGIGYRSAVRDNDYKNYKYLHEDLVNNGLVRELAGRIGVVTEVFELTREELKEALVEKKQSALSDYTRLYKFLGAELALTDSDFDAIINICLERKIGARGLRTALHDYLLERVYKLQYEVD